MDANAKQAFIRQKAAQRRVDWSRHALARLTTQPITVDDVEAALQQAEVIEDYPHHRRYLPDCLVLVHVPPVGAVHCVVAVNQPADRILVITVYRPSDKEWNSDARRRK